MFRVIEQMLLQFQLKCELNIQNDNLEIEQRDDIKLRTKVDIWNYISFSRKSFER